MTVLTAGELARNLSRILERVEHDGEEVVIVRGDHPIVRIGGRGALGRLRPPRPWRSRHDRA